MTYPGLRSALASSTTTGRRAMREQRAAELFAALGYHWRRAPRTRQYRLIRVTMEARRVTFADCFRFFCGCCWRAITDLQEDARRVLETEH